MIRRDTVHCGNWITRDVVRTKASAVPYWKVRCASHPLAVRIFKHEVSRDYCVQVSSGIP